MGSCSEIDGKTRARLDLGVEAEEGWCSAIDERRRVVVTRRRHQRECGAEKGDRPSRAREGVLARKAVLRGGA